MAVQQHLSTISGISNEAVSVQAGKLVKSFDQDTRLNILKIANIPPVEISPEHMIAMKVDLAIPWKKLKTISRYFVHIEHLKIIAKFSFTKINNSSKKKLLAYPILLSH